MLKIRSLDEAKIHLLFPTLYLIQFHYLYVLIMLRMASKSNPIRYKLLLVLFVLSTSCFAQEEDRLLKAAREVIANSGPVALITLDSEGLPRVRAMDPFPPEEDFTVWLATVPGSRKVGQIRGNPNVTLYYLNESKTGYVMIRGKANLVEDAESKKKYWKEGWEKFYPNYPEGYMLIRVSPSSLEIISEDHHILGDKDTWEPPVVKFE